MVFQFRLAAGSTYSRPMISEIRKHFNSHDAMALVAFGVFVLALLLPNPTWWVAAIFGLFLAVAISAAVHSAEVLAQKLGPSLGTLILALAVTVIEVALIVSLMANKSPESATVARDTVFAAIMIVTNGIIGVCILLGGIRHKELGFQPMGTSALLSILVALSAFSFVLPNYTTSSAGPTYTASQLIFVSVVSLVLYGSLVWAQTKSHKSYFVALKETDLTKEEAESYVPSQLRAWMSFGILLLALVTVVGLAKILSPSIEAAVAAAGAPRAVVGIVIALLVLAPETLAAVNAARVNQLQTSLNLALGSGAASVALTIPVVSVYSIITDSPLSLGLDAKSTALLVLTFVAGSLTFGVGRSTALHGIVHLMILFAYVALALMP